MARATPSGPVYTVAHVTAGIAAHLKAWVGRTVLAQGTVGAMMTLPF